VLHEPILNFDFSLAETSKRRGWQTANNYCMWVGLQAEGVEPYRLLVKPGDRILLLPLKPRMMHMIPAGCPYRMVHRFAPWRVSDADTIYMRVVEPEGTYTALVAALSRPVREDHLVWICPHCGHEMGREPFDSQRNGLVAFWDFHLARVREAGHAPKPCPGCGRVHPQGYGFDPVNDNAAEAAARREW
jgi:hypothetical protein